MFGLIVGLLLITLLVIGVLRVVYGLIVEHHRETLAARHRYIEELELSNKARGDLIKTQAAEIRDLKETLAVIRNLTGGP